MRRIVCLLLCKPLCWKIIWLPTCETSWMCRRFGANKKCLSLVQINDCFTEMVLDYPTPRPYIRQIKNSGMQLTTSMSSMILTIDAQEFATTYYYMGGQ
jgi:hypothetical protein